MKMYNYVYKRTINDDRYKCGKNWSRLLSVLSDEQIVQAERSLTEMLWRLTIWRAKPF